MSITLWDVILEGVDPSNFDSEARRKLINDKSKQMYRYGLSGKQALDTFRNAGLGIATADFYNIWNENKSSVISLDNLSGLPGDYEVALGDLKVGNVDTKTLYSYTVGYKYYDPEADVVYYSTTNIDSDQLGTIGELTQLAIDDISSKYPRLGEMELLDATILRAQINPYHEGY